MNKSICNICGGNLINKNGRWVCENCGAFLPEEITNEQLSLLYDANQKLRLADFDLAEELYSDIIRKYSDCSDAYFGRALAHYGIRLEKDVDGRMIPTCFFPEYQSLFENSDFKKAYDLADSKQKQYLKEKADEIEAIRKEWVDKAKKEGPYDIFISFKATKPDDDTEETEDSREAWDIARELEKCGYRVFFSKDALANKTGDHYEPYIFNALNTCHVMLVYASKPEYVESVWVRNEWARYYEKIKNKEDGKLPNSLILIYKNFNPSKDLRRPFSHSENINRNDIDFLDRLKNYVASVISESKIITPKVIPDKIESYIPPKNERLKGAKKKIVGNSIAPSGSFVPTVQIREKAFGKYSTQKLTGTAESELSRGEVLLRKKRYNEALDCYKGILLNNKNNAKAALGVLLSASECTDLGEFISNKYVGSDEQNKLINVVIQYSKKDVTNQIFEQMIAFIKLEIKKADNIELAYKAYKEIKDFNSSEAVRKCHKEICDELLKKKCFSNDSCFAFIDDILFNCQTGYDTYVNALLAVINALIDSSMFEKACAYLKLLEKVAFGTKDYYSCLYRIYARQSTFAEALLAYINGGNIKKIVGDIDGTNTDTANWILNNLINTILASYTKISIDVLSDAFSVLTCYVNPYVDRLTDTLMAYCISEPSPEVDKLFETILQSFSESRKNEFIECIFAYAKAYMERSDFNSAKKYLNYALQYDRTNANLLCYLFYASIESIDETNVYRNLYKLKDFGTIEKILGLQKNDDEIAKTNAKFVEEAISYVSKYGKSSEKGIFPVFEQLIKYYAADCTDQLIKDLYNMADACKESTLFEEAEKYYALIVGTDSSEHAAYWGLLQAKLKCRNESEMIEQDVLINALPEFNNAITSAGNNKSVIEKYIDCSISQQKYLESKKRKKKNRKIFVAVSSVTASVLLVFCLVFSLAVNIFIPNSKYENAVSLINNRKYYQAYEQLKGFDYADSSSQLSIAKAGLAFDRGDYKEGIDCMYNVGGITNINYDGNGGKVPASSQTVKKLKNWVNNEPLYAGYSFYGWVIDSFSIKTRKNSYLCNLNLKATWKAKKYKISYDLNGGDNSPANLNEYTIETPTFTLSDPVKNGYDFVGWSGTGISGVSKDVSIEKGSIGNREFTANWEEHTYKVTLDARGGSCSSSELSVDYNSILILPEPTKNGYSFVGWYNSIDNTLISNCTWKYLSDLSLYAKWSLDSHTITYVLNGGINNSGNPSEFTFESNDIVILNPSRPGYTFTGWDSILGDNQIEPTILNGSYTNLTFEATWTANLNTIIFNGNSNTSGSMDSIQGYTDSTIKLSQNKFVKDGYHFKGWSLTNNGLTKFVDEDDYKVTTDAITILYAIWEANVNSITYYGNGSDSGSMDKQYLSTDESSSLNNNAYSKTGYHFVGWSSTSNGEVEYSDEDTYLMGVNNNYDLYAIWEPNEYQISYNTNGGKISCDSHDVLYDASYKLDIPTRDGYSFGGWYIGDDQLTDSSGNSLNEYVIAGNITVIAHWSPNLNALLLTNGSETIKVYGNTDSLVRIPKNTFTKENYCFRGWSTKESGSIDYYDQDLFYMGPNSSYTLHAIFDRKSDEVDRTGWIPISSADDLKKINNDLYGKYYLTSDIDMNGIPWIPIGSYRSGNTTSTSDKCFHGTIDGNGYAIYNFSSYGTTTYYYTKEGLSYDHTIRVGTGLIGYNCGTLNNIKIYNANIIYEDTTSSRTSGSNYDQLYIYGAILCSYNAGTIKDCFVQGQLSVNTKYLSVNTTEGICGYCWLRKLNICGICGKNTSKIENCSANVILSSNRSAEMGEISNSNTISGRTFKSENTVFFNKGFIWYSLSNGTYRYQEANFHRLVPVLDSLESKEGYEFAGWSMTENGDVDFYVGDDCYIPYDQTFLILYPVWTPRTNKIIFNSNGADGIMNEQSIHSDEDLKLNLCTYVAPYGYHFKGWSLTEHGETIYGDGDTINCGISSITNLYAVWEPNVNHIVFNANGGSGSMANQEICTDETASLKKCSFVAPLGYYFAGWSLAPNGPIEYYDGSNITSNGASTINLYAVWNNI